MHRFRLLITTVAALFLATAFQASLRAQDLTIYDDALASGWQSWSWASVNLASTTTVRTGTNAIAVTPSAWSALSLRHAPMNTAGYGKVTFWVNGGATGGQRLRISATLNDTGQPAVTYGPLAANTWAQVSIPLASLGAENVANFTGIWVQEGAGAAQPTFYVDDVVLTRSIPVTPPPPLVGMALYEDAFVNGWQNWSWATVNPASTTLVNSGASAIAVDARPYTAVSFHHSAMETDLYASLTFWINGGPVGGQTLKIVALLGSSAQPATVTIGPLAANTWQKFSFPLSAFGIDNKPNLEGFWFQESAGLTQPTFYLDDVRLDLAPPPALVNVNVQSRNIIRKVDARMFGMNTAVWDSVFATATTAELLNELDNQVLRFPGGSLSDEYHWKTNTTEGQTFQWATDFDEFAAIALATQAQVYITANYGTGTPEEAAEWVHYSNVTKGYGFKYWEIGNENYGTWEADKNNRPHDPVTYATRYQEYSRQMKAVDPSIKIGAVIVASENENANYTDQTVVNPRTGQSHNGWTAVLLSTFAKLGITPDYVIYHRYEQGPGGENDTFLLNSSKTWKNDAASIRQMLTDYLGEHGRQVEITCTENNSVFGNPGKQTTSLVNGLFLADSLGNIMQTEFNAFIWWDFRNGQEAGNNNSPSLYGWRRYGDYGIVNGANPARPADRYPTFYVYKLLKHYARGGERVIEAASDYKGVGVYAVRSGAQLRLLVINKHPTATLNLSINIADYKPNLMTTVYSYGIPQDEAARTGTGSADIATTRAMVPGSTFTFKPAPYSATVINLTRQGGPNADDQAISN